MVTVALDMYPDHATQWIDAAQPTHPSLIDTRHVTGELFGFTNIPMAVWIDESGTIVRNAESSTIERSALRDVDIDESLPDDMKSLLTEVKAIPDHAETYRAAIVDWVEKGAHSPYALTAEQVIERSRPRTNEHAQATAAFELGQHFELTGNHEAAISWWKRAHELDPDNWTYQRQAWTLESTPSDATANDLLQDVGDVYGTSWLDTVISHGGGKNYAVEPTLD